MRIHFIGIGGIGISALAKIYLKKGHEIQGSDSNESEITKELQKEGVKIFIGQKKENLKTKPNLVIYSEAVPSENPEILEAKRLKIKCLSGAEAIGELSKDYFVIAVSGMHGKSTTSSMIAQILIKAGLDPTFIIGTKPGSRLGKSEYLVLEADDYKAKFLHYYPNILVLTNIEEEHMDYFKNLNHIFKVFGKYILQVKNYIVANRDDRNVVKVLKSKFRIPNSKQMPKAKTQRPKIIFYSLKQKERAKLKKILKVPGKHNVANALAALNVARILKINDKVAFRALGEYNGIWRRFEERTNRPYKRISDYAHHPTEIKATLRAAKERYKNKKIWCVFQPHQYQRTYYLFNKFVKVFREHPVERLFITDVYDVEGREDKKIKKKVSAEKLTAAIGKKWASYLPKNEVVNHLKKNLKKGRVIILMGAGDIYKLFEQF